MEINHDQRRLVVTKLTSILGTLRDCTIGIFGLALKPNTDHMREAPRHALDHAHLSISSVPTSPFCTYRPHRHRYYCAG
jgi:UDP-glucose 6-dehydrogenase